MDIRSVSPATPQYHPMGYPSQLVAPQIQSVVYPQPHQQQQQRIPQQKQQPSPLAGPPSTYYAVTAQYPMPGALYPTSLQPRYSHSLVGPPSLSPLGGPVQYDYRLMNRPQPGNALAPMPPGYQSAPGEYQE